MSASPLVSASFWRQALERAAKTAGQALVVLWGSDGAGIVFADWRGYVAAAVGGAIASLATSLASAPASAAPGSPSLVTLDPAPRPWGDR